MYVLDTSILIEISKYYFPEIFPSLWDRLKFLVMNDDLISLKEVQEELKKDKKTSKFWNNFNSQCDNKLFRELDDGEENQMINILSLDIYREDFTTKKKGQVVISSLEEEWGYGSVIPDPLLICHGLHHGSTVVTLESPSKGHNIPDVCWRLEVNCIGLREFFKDANFRI